MDAGPDAADKNDTAELAGLRTEIDAVGRQTVGRVELGGRAMVVAVAVLVLIGGLSLPWMAGRVGLAGAAR